MLTSEGCADRRRRLRERVGKADLLVVSLPQHLTYLAGLILRPTELSSWGHHFLLIDRDGGSRLVVDNLAEAPARNVFADATDVWPWYDMVGAAGEKLGAAVNALGETVGRHYRGAKTIAVELAHLPAAARDALGAVEVVDLTPHLAAMRQVKDDDEVACIRRAIKATEAGHAAARQILRPGLTEVEVYAEVTAAITRAAGEPIVMLGDFAAGDRSTSGGGPPTANVLREGDLMILDLFPLIAGYRADITNTLCVGQPTPEQEQHMEALKAAMRAGEAAMKPGVTGGEIYKAVKDSLAEAGLGDLFRHHAGHALGLGHPEAPFLVPASRDLVQAGNVLTLEPGAYRPGWGGARIEHNYLVTGSGFERLSNHEIRL